MKTLLLIIIPLISNASNLVVKDNSSLSPIPLVMVTQKSAKENVIDTSDGGYPPERIPFHVLPEITKFTRPDGSLSFTPTNYETAYRFRKFGYKDLLIPKNLPSPIKLTKETDIDLLAQSKPANIWLGALNVGSDEDKNIFKMQCGFCHQQGTEFTRMERSPEEWKEVIQRMVRYGSRIPSDLQKKLPDLLSLNYKNLVSNPSKLEDFPQWKDNLKDIQITEWPIGDSMSQTHDMLVSKNSMIYVADNIQDRLFELDLKTNNFTIYKIPHLEGDAPGGLLAPRLKDFPSHDSTSNAHSLAESHVDGHIFITPSAQQRLIEFDPLSKKFKIHQMSDGFYPHTIRLDHEDNVWFTLALSNQVAKFNRKNKTFKYYNLPARSFKEKILTRNIKWVFKLMDWGVPLSNWFKIDRQSTGVPLVYGIDITPDGKVWFARLHTNEIGMIDPKTDKITMIKTPFMGPRRLRTDKNGTLWIAVFGESRIASYDPKTKSFEQFDLPVTPIGSETPYSLNVDLPRDLVWVNGNQSDALYVFDIKTKTWTHSIPLPRRTTFTRDIEFDKEGTAYSANSNFPSWHIEDEQPTLIQIKINR